MCTFARDQAADGIPVNSPSELACRDTNTYVSRWKHTTRVGRLQGITVVMEGSSDEKYFGTLVVWVFYLVPQEAPSSCGTDSYFT
jgi:hypothetical protein